jgi:DNA-binding MarR family transcriptional regulator
VASLVEAGLLRRAGRPSDRRAVELSLTAQGVAVGKEVRRVERALREWLATALGARDVAATAICHAVGQDDTVISEIAEWLAAAHVLGE